MSKRLYQLLSRTCDVDAYEPFSGLFTIHRAAVDEHFAGVEQQTCDCIGTDAEGADIKPYKIAKQDTYILNVVINDFDKRNN